MGDFSGDLLTHKDILESEVLKFCTSNDMSQLIENITRPKSGTLLDHIYVNSRVYNVTESGIVDFHITDHSPVYLLIKCTRNKIKKKDC